MKSERPRSNKAETGINRCRHIIIGKTRKEREGRHSLKEPRGSRRKIYYVAFEWYRNLNYLLCLLFLCLG